MSLFDIFRLQKKPTTAAIAKERLQIIVAHERATRNTPDYLPQLQQEILAVITKYVKIDQDRVQVNLQNVGSYSVLELNVTLPEEEGATEY
jgi:cell division topological specificity factor